MVKVIVQNHTITEFHVETYLFYIRVVFVVEIVRISFKAQVLIQHCVEAFKNHLLLLRAPIGCYSLNTQQMQMYIIYRQFVLLRFNFETWWSDIQWNQSFIMHIFSIFIFTSCWQLLLIGCYLLSTVYFFEKLPNCDLGSVLNCKEIPFTDKLHRLI